VKKGTQWPIGVVVVLTLTIGLNIYIAFRANDDPSVSAESDYYQKAVRFDADQAMRRRGERLGWHLTLVANSATVGEATLTAELVDSTGAPVHGAVVRLTARHVARGDEPISAAAREEGNHYVATLPMVRRGLWDVDVEIVRGTDRFVTGQRLDLPTAN
jgi:nitrogen fixation protein FixH